MTPSQWLAWSGLSKDDQTLVLDAEAELGRIRTRQVILESGHPDAARIVADFDQNCRDLDNGTMGARNAWNSISSAQKRVLTDMHFRRFALVARIGNTAIYDAVSDCVLIYDICRIKTVRALAARDLLDWDGGAFTPEARAILSDRARFVIAHGRPKT